MKKLLILLLLSFSIQLSAQERHGLYVADFDVILVDETAELKLLQYCERTGTNSLTLYQLDEVDLNIEENRQLLRKFIQFARIEYNIKHFGAASESFKNFKNNIHIYNLDKKTKRHDRINAYNIEFEFWNKIPSSEYYCTNYLEPAGFPCTQDGAFQYVLRFIKGLRALANQVPGTEVEIYVGWIDEDHARLLTPKVDRVYYAVYRDPEPDGSLNLYNFGMQRERLKYLGAAGPIEIIPIFSGFIGSTDPNLSWWLRQGNHPIKAWWHYIEAFKKDKRLRNRHNLDVAGYQWFYYNVMPSGVAIN